MKVKRYTCVVCGRVFPQGQGIVLKRAGVELAFHSKVCLSKFFKLFIERIDEGQFRKAAREAMKEFEELRKAKQIVKRI
ncbi:MAG TPA: hypothetical protein EYH50_00130 [Pyrodictium delaneyi]|uniref:Uncharacterized protein n=1 Tax=Pyrodictium delaneyi TaxID=1273541 RepID=A0A833E868_9CREN|nr:hypothetical protein [Pyrodictium delaneyi]